MSEFDRCTTTKTLRDEIAIEALGAWISNSPKIGGENLKGTADHAKSLSECAYRYADAMLEARKES